MLPLVINTGGGKLTPSYLYTHILPHAESLYLQTDEMCSIVGGTSMVVSLTSGVEVFSIAAQKTCLCTAVFLAYTW